MIFALATGAGLAAEAETVAAQDVEQMTPAQIRALQAGLEQENAATRGENADLRRRIEALEQRHAAREAKKAELEAKLAEVLEQLASLKGKAESE